MNSDQAPPPRKIDSWQVAEANAVDWMRHWGFRDATQTAGGADGGIDVRSSRALAQVKFEARQVGAPAVQRLVGARGMGGQQLIFFSGAGFAAPAVAYADVMKVALFKYDLLGRPMPSNGVASRMVETLPDTRHAAFPMTIGQPTSGRHIPVWSALPPAWQEWLRRHWAIIVGPILVLTAFDTWIDALDGEMRSDAYTAGESIAAFLSGCLLTVWYLSRRKRSSE